MKRGKSIIAVGILTLLLLLILAGCSGDTIKASYHSSRSENDTEEESRLEITADPQTDCSAVNPHPLAESMTEQFEVSYEEIMTWYCDGYSFSDILLALETELLVDQSMGELLILLRTQTWEEIWQDLGLESAMEM